MNQEALALIPRRARLLGYLLFVGLLMGHGAITAGYAVADVDAPLWLTVSGGVLTFLATAPLLVAVFNLPSASDAAPVPPYEDGAEVSAYEDTTAAADREAAAPARASVPIILG